MKDKELDMELLKKKQVVLKKSLKEHTRFASVVAFSGGADSSLLLKYACDAASEQRTKVYAVFFQTRLHPQEDRQIAERTAKGMGAVFMVEEIDELQDAGIENNPKDRCYRCKRAMFQKLKDVAARLEAKVIMEGTNEDDLHVFRPGIKALKELDVLSPLAEAGMTKSEVRICAREAGISVADRPSAPCLATRFPYGTHLDYKLLKKINQKETFLRDLGIYNVRIRVHGVIARIEVDPEYFLILIEYRDVIVQKMKEIGLLYVTIDLEGYRSGSMDGNENIKTRNLKTSYTQGGTL